MEMMEMKFSQSTRTVLDKIEFVAKTKADYLKRTIPSVFLIGNRGDGGTEFAKEYERILSNNGVYETRGRNTFLELVFPGNGSERDYQRFFASPKRAASVQNKYYGVFAISFEEWEGKDLIESEQFNKLLTFIDNNKETIFFIFQVRNDFKEIDNLKRILRYHINLVEASLEKPDLDMCVDYIVRNLEMDGFTFSDNGKRELIRVLEKKLNGQVSYLFGYHSLRQITENIEFELLALGMFENKFVQISEYIIQQIESNIIVPEIIKRKTQAIGFSK